SARPACPRKSSGRPRILTPGLSGRKSAGRLASPSITTPWTTFSPSSTLPSSPDTWAAMAVVSTPCAARTMSRGAEIWAQSPTADVRDDIAVRYNLARRLGHNWGEPNAECIWDEVRSLSPMHAGMSYRRLEELGGIQWPCYDESHPGEMYLHSRLWQTPLIG